MIAKRKAPPLYLPHTIASAEDSPEHKQPAVGMVVSIQCTYSLSIHFLSFSSGKKLSRESFSSKAIGIKIPNFLYNFHWIKKTGIGIRNSKAIGIILKTMLMETKTRSKNLRLDRSVFQLDETLLSEVMYFLLRDL